MMDRQQIDDRAPRRERTAVLAVVFGVASVPWTYAFVVTDVPLWPSFVAAATFSAAGGGIDGLVRGAAGNLIGVLYATATLAIVGIAGGGPLVLATVVGGFMLIASLHALVPLLSFAPSAFFGYATLFGIHATGATILAGGLAGETVVAGGAMVAGTTVGFAVEQVADRLTPERVAER